MTNINPLIDKIWTPRKLTQHCAGLLDLDSTIADNSQRLQFIPKRDADEKTRTLGWQKYNELMDEDQLNSHVYKMYCYICGFYPTIRRIIITGRQERYRHTTVKWLLKNNIDVDEIYMRKDGDFRANAIIKQELIADLVAQNIKSVFGFEDDIEACKMMTAQKIYVYQVVPPNQNIVPFIAIS